MRINPPAVADPDTFTVRRTIRIAAPPEKVWTAVTEPEHISRWFGRIVLIGEGVGAHGTIAWPDEAAMPIRVEAIASSLDHLPVVQRRHRPRAGTVDDAPSTVFTFTLEPTPDGTLLTVEETGFEMTADPAGSLESHRQGWDGELDKLVRLLEGGSL